jgi:DNA-binding transcriptional regulator WhiA
VATSTLSGDAKDALARSPVDAQHCKAALRDGLLVYGMAPGSDVFRTQRPAIARLLWSLLDERKEHPIRRVPGTRLHRFPSYEIDVAATEAGVPRARCDRRMELRAAFLACGSLAAPARGYHLEFVPPSEAALRRLVAVLRAEGVHPKVAPRKGRGIVYFKNIEEITQVLAAIGSSGALLHLEDVRALKETKNRIHRLVNTEAANVDRAASAAASQRRWIALLADAYGLRKLSAPLREIAELRLAHPSETLAELGRRCSPEAKKSTVNGRIATLVRLAKSLSDQAARDVRRGQAEGAP